MLAGEDFRLAVRGLREGQTTSIVGVRLSRSCADTGARLLTLLTSEPSPAGSSPPPSDVSHTIGASHRRPTHNARKENMTQASDTTIHRHTSTCPIPTRGGKCNCQPEHDPSIDPWPQLSGEQYEVHADSSRLPASPFRPGGRHQMFSRSMPLDLLVDERQPAA